MDNMDIDKNGDAQFDPTTPHYPPLPEADDPEDWMYTMRRTMQEIVPGLFLGPYAVATRANLEPLKAAGVTHIVCVRSDVEAHLIRANHNDHFQYLIVQMDDSPVESIISKVKTVSLFIETCLNSGGKVLVHGNAGMSRSAALVVGYIMSRYGVTFKKANAFVQGKRFCLSISEVFANQLKEYEPIYRAMHSMPALLPGEDGDMGNSGWSSKRKADDDDEEMKKWVCYQ